MIKQFLIITLIAILSSSNFVSAQAPNWLWAKSSGGNDYDSGISVSTDAGGNVFMIGMFESPTITFGTITLTNSGDADICIVKYDASGNVLWAKSADGISNDFARGISTDSNGNVFVTGGFASPTITFGTITLTNAGDNDIFIVKYDASGNELWAKSAGGNSWEHGQGISTDINGNVFITGGFASPTITFGATTLTNSGTVDIFIVKYDASGNEVWAKSADGINLDRGYSVSADAGGNVFITGMFQSATITFGTITLNNAGNQDNFIVKYDVNGNVLWARSDGCTGNDIGWGVSTDFGGNVYLTGEFEWGTITFGTTNLINAGFRDIFIVKYDASGNVLWAKSAGGNGEDSGFGVSTDASGNVIITGRFHSPIITFGTMTLSNVGNGDIFIAKYDANGNVLWAKGSGGNNLDYGASVSADPSGNIFIGGTYWGIITFGTTTLNNAGTFDIFIAKLDTAMTTGIAEQIDYSTIVISPNPFASQTTISFKDEQKNTNIKIVDVMGKVIKNLNFNGKQLVLEKGEMQPGIYFVQVIHDNNNFSNRRIVIQ